MEEAKRRWSPLGLHIAASSALKSSSFISTTCNSSNSVANTTNTQVLEQKLHERCDIEYNPTECEITPERLQHARQSIIIGNGRMTGCALGEEELQALVAEQQCIKRMLITGSIIDDGDDLDQVIKEEENNTATANMPHHPPQDQNDRRTFSSKLRNLQAQLFKLKVKSRHDQTDDGVLGVLRQGEKGERQHHFNSMIQPLRSQLSHCGSIRNSNYRGSVIDEEFVKYNMKMHDRNNNEEKSEDNEEDILMNVEYLDYVRKPDLANIIDEYESIMNHPKYSLKQVIFSRRFFLYAHRFANAQYQRTLVYPTLPQPPELYGGFDVCGECNENKKKTKNITEKERRRPKGHRFIITADTQFGILMDGFAMISPNWSQEIEISRKCVEQINAMEGDDRPLFVCVCGDLVDTEGSFSGAIASWKKVMKGWERNLIFEQQVKDFKRVWSGLHADIALVCLCGNHDIGNRPTNASIEHWTSSFGDDYLSFWVNGTFNLCLNNCLFSNPTGAPDLFDEQLQWMEEKLVYARQNDATHIFVMGHFPWFLKHEDEADDEINSHSAAPLGWGPPGTKFEDGYFTIPYKYRKIAMALFKKYDVTACFSGHFHQNVTAKSSWGMPMIVTGPLSMNLKSSISHELDNGDVNGIGMRIVDVGEKGAFTHKWTLLDNEEEIFEHAIKRCERQLELEEKK